MDPIVTLALVGTARQQQTNPATGLPVDALIEEVSAEEAERKLLLSAGAWAIYRQAGHKAQQIATLPEPAPQEKLRACSPAVALVLSRLLNGEQTDLLPEALARLREVGRHLPYSLLPMALNKSGKDVRAALFPVLGERGLWLSSFNPAWNWMRDFLPADESGLPAEAETIWQEGTSAQRAEILRRLRAVDPDKARDWLEAVWKQEKAEVRNDLLSTLEIGLGTTDEAFLEKALDDRAASVRTVAVSLLAHIPASAFIERMCQRGQAMLSMQKKKLVINPPQEFDKAWLRDGLTAKPPHGLGPRAWWLLQILTFIPPTFWEKHLGAGPADLLRLVANLRGEWDVQAVEGWSKAAVRFQTENWISLLWNFWNVQAGKIKSKTVTDYSVREQLFKCLSVKEAESIVLAVMRLDQNVDQQEILAEFAQTMGEAKEETLLALERAAKNNDWGDLISELPRPWSVEFGCAYLRICRAYFAALEVEKEKFNPYSDSWLGNLATMALALPSACLVEAQQPLEIALPEDMKSWQANYARDLLKNYTEIVHLRTKIYEEIV